jgi:serine/threonine protein kinase
MGEVYLALDTALNRKVAIKFLSQNSVNSEQARKRLVREARAAAALDLVMRAHCVPALPGPQYREAPASSTCLHFGQSQAFADFDGDHRLDLATLTWVGRIKAWRSASAVQRRAPSFTFLRRALSADRSSQRT